MEAGREMDALARRFAGRFSYLLRELGVERSTEEILGWEWNHATWEVFIRLDNASAALSTVGALPGHQPLVPRELKRIVRECLR